MTRLALRLTVPLTITSRSDEEEGRQICEALHFAVRHWVSLPYAVFPARRSPFLYRVLAGGIYHPFWVHRRRDAEGVVYQYLFLPADPDDSLDGYLFSILRRPSITAIRPGRRLSHADCDMILAEEGWR